MKRLLVALVPVLLVAAACGSEDDGSSTSVESRGSAAAHNDADVEFAQAMIPHHEQAVEMARMASTRSQHPEVRALAEAIEAAQAPEIRTLRGWLEDWDAPVEAGAGHHGGSSGGMGMMSEDDMGLLEAADGVAFDRSFLELMIEHHRGAIAMAHQQQEDGEFPDAMAMAREIESTQEAEITVMQRLLEEL